MDNAPEPLADSSPPVPQDFPLPEHYRVCQREDGACWQLGLGTVYKATDLRTDETVALRFCAAGARDPDTLGALAEYVALLARPVSPQVVPLRDFFISGPFNVAVTEFISGESLAGRVRQEGPLAAKTVWHLAGQLLDGLASLHALGVAHGSLGPAKILFPDGAATGKSLRLVGTGLYPSAGVAADPAAGSDATRADLRCLGATLWFALTGHELATLPDAPLPWQLLDIAGITPELGALPVLLARTLTGEPAQRPATAPMLLETLNVLASLGSVLPDFTNMPRGASHSDPLAPRPTLRPPGYEVSDSWPRSTPPRAALNRRRREPRSGCIPPVLLAIGGLVGFFVGVAYQENRQSPAVLAIPPPAPETAALSSPSNPSKRTPPAPVPSTPEPPVSAAALNSRLARIKTVQPDLGNILRYAREIRRVGTLSVTDPENFPTEAEVTWLLERFEWNDPASPNSHHTPLVLLLGFSNEQPPPAQGQAATPDPVDALAQAIEQMGISSPIYPCHLGRRDNLPEVDPAHANDGQFVEVWVAFTLF